MADPMAMGRVFKDNKGRINSVDFHRTHDFLVAGHDAGFISIYGTYEGRKITSLDCSKYGVAHISFTHHPKCLLHASTEASGTEPVHDHALRYLSHHDNRYLRFYKGHTERVTSLSLSPKSDNFITTALDKRLLMWDLRVAQAQACMDVPGQPYGAMDEEGLVFAVACGGSGLVSLFDARSYAGGPFLSFPLPLQQHKLADAAPIACLKFSTNQQHMLAVVDGRIFVMDTFDGREVVTWDTGVRDSSTPVEASFSPDGSYVMAGTSDNHIKVWKCPPVPEDENAPPPALTQADRHPVATWPTPHPCLPICAKWSPTRKLAVSACRALCMWIPVEAGHAETGHAPHQGYG